MSNEIIHAQNVSFAYDKGDTVIQDVSFSIKENTVVMIIGPNGSGKTTLLKALVGLIEPTEGHVTVCETTPSAARDKIGYVPQRLSIDNAFPLTVYEFLTMSKRSPDDNVEAEMEHLGIAGLGDKLIGQLSGGQLQRTLIARSLLGNPKVLFLDEPVSGIDIGGEESFYELIKDVQEKHNVTVVMVSHEVQLVTQIADQVICLNKKMLCSGTPENALAPEIMKELYGDNMSVYKHHE